MKNLLYLLLSLATCLTTLLGFSSCNDEINSASQSANTNLFAEDGRLRLSATLDIPKMSQVVSRATLDDTPDYDNLQLYALVFEVGTGLCQYEKIEVDKHQADDKHDHLELATYTITLNPTYRNAVIHLIATNQPQFENQIRFGTEETLITSLYTDNNYEAYWQRIDFNGYIPSVENTNKTHENYRENAEQQAEHIKELMTHVPMVRNFCRVSVNTDAVDANFTLTGLYVVNTVDRGSIAPYVPENPTENRFINYFRIDASGAQQPLGYNDISSQNHIGTLISGVKLINNDLGSLTTKSESESGAVKPVYIYERPARENSTERTYAIIRGKRAGSIAESYYKVDLGHISDTELGTLAGVFEYYNLLRNFDYVIKLLAVDSEGYSTIEEAAKGSVFNNFSATVEARNMFSISDGIDMLNVNHLTFVFTQANQKINIEAQYRTGINDGVGGETENEMLHIEWEEGDVIKDISAPKTIIGSDGKEWNSYEVINDGKVLDGILREQKVYIYRGRKEDGTYGLYRVLHFFSHTPWTFKNVGVFPGLWLNNDEYPNWEWPKDEREIGQLKGSNLTLFFELPAGLPQAIFPLKFVIETNRQNIQNAYQGNAVVQSVPAKKSIFYDQNNPNSDDNPKTSRIQYVKTITWEEYYGGLSEESVGKSNYIVRCPFLTITDLSQEGVGNDDGTSHTYIRIKNDYFGSYDTKTGRWLAYVEDEFVRDNNTSDPSPRNWNFTAQYWDNLLFEMNRRHEDSSFGDVVYTSANNTNDELTFVDGGPQTLTSGVNTANALRYVQMTNTNDKMLTHLKYDNQTKRTIRLIVTSTNNNGIRTAPTISITSVPTKNITVPTANTGTPSGQNYPEPYIYDIEIPSDVTDVDIAISPSPTQVNMRFFQVELYPRWDSFQNALQ